MIENSNLINCAKYSDNNLFFFPTVVVCLQYAFVIFAFSRNDFFFIPTVLLLDGIICSLWLLLCINRFIRIRNSLDLQKIFALFIIFFVSSFLIFKVLWFDHYLRLDATERFFNGMTFIDTLYHSVIAESCITNGYPSINMNAPTFLAYHALSHYMIAGVSKVLNLPCFIIYNYIYPVIAIPLFVYLLQKLALIAKVFVSKENSLSIIDYFFISFVSMGFGLNKSIYSALGHSVPNIFLSESCLIALILTFLYFCIIDYGYKKISYFDMWNKLILIPIFIIILSYAKISNGCMFCCGISYYIFRKSLRKNNQYLFAFIYLFVFGCYYFIFPKFSMSFPHPPSSGSRYELFHYVRHYTKNALYSMLHYIILFLPIVLVYLCKISEEKKLNTAPGTGNRILFETLAVTTVVSCLPGVFMKINGGSAAYFVKPVWFEACIILIAMNIPQRIMNFIFLKCIKTNIRCFYNSRQKAHFNIAVIVIFLVFIVGRWKYISLSGMLKSLFDVSNTGCQWRDDFNLFNEINSVTKKHKRDYCLFLCDDFNLINIYDREWGRYNRTYLINPYFAASAYTGLTIINAMYFSENKFYRGDGIRFGEYKDFLGYSIPPAICDKKITIENMKDEAFRLGKKYVVVLKNDSFEVVSVNPD